MPALRPLITAFMSAMGPLLDVGAIMLVFFLIYGIAGMNLFMGTLRHQCYVHIDESLSVPAECPFVNNEACVSAYARWDSTVPFTSDINVTPFEPHVPDRLCSMHKFGRECPIVDVQHFRLSSADNSSTTATVTVTPAAFPSVLLMETSRNGTMVDSNKSSVSRVQSVCVEEARAGGALRNPAMFREWISFDNLGFAFVVVFQSITLEGWTDIMYLYEEVMSPGLASTHQSL